MSALRTLLPYFRPYRAGMIWGLVLVVIAQGFAMVGPWLMKLAIDGLSDPATTRGDLGLLAMAMVAAAVLGGAARYGMRELLNGISRRIEVDLRDDFFRHLLRLDTAFFGSNRTGDLMSRATNDTLAVRQAAGPAIMYSVNTIVGFVLALALMLTISVRLTLLALIPLVFLPPLVLAFGKVIHRRFEEIQDQYSKLSTMVQESLTGMRIVRAYNQEAAESEAFAELNREYRGRNMALAKAAGAFHPMMGLLAGFGMVVVLWVGGVQVMEGTMTVGDYVAFFFYLALLVWPMIALGWVVNLFQRGAASMGRLNRVLEREPEITAPERPNPAADAVTGEVVFDRVSFTWPGTERPVLREVSFEARPGQTVAIVGPTGSGKSTLVSLIPRLFDPTGGEVRIDGVPAPEWDPATLRGAIGMVPQDAFLFSDTLRGNIGLGLTGARAVTGEGEAGAATGGETQAASGGIEVERGPGAAAVADPAMVEAAARSADLHDSIVDFPAGYETLLGERGINLSGGQKQRATLARALARSPRILILDDALSAVDTRTEARILEELRSVMADRTAFVVSHRVSAVMAADLILVLEDGEIVERGRHDELIEAEGTYARLLRRQLLEDEMESGVGTE